MGPDWPLAGRHDELERVGQAVLAGGGSVGIVLAGPAGVGKTRLAREGLSMARRRGAVTPWVGATASAASIPLGALASLLPRLGGSSQSSGLELLHQAMSALVEGAAGRRLVLGLDDAHLLDDTSATLVHQLVLSQSATVVATVRSGHPAPDSVVALWKDRLLDRLELQPLSRSQVQELVSQALGGPLDSVTLERLWQLTQGNVLFLREVVEGARGAHQLVQRAGVWRWEGEFTPTPVLTELLRGRVGQVSAQERTLIEAVAYGEPLGLTLVVELTSAETVRECERRGLVTVETDGRRRQVWLTHPLYGEAVRAETSALAALDVRRALARLQRPERLRRRGDVLRHATFQLEAEGGADPELLTAAAGQACHVDPSLAERMARAAIAAGGGFDAHMALATALQGQGRMGEAEVVLTQAAAMSPHPEKRAAAALALAPNLFWGQGRVEEADSTLELAHAAGASTTVSHRLLAMRAAFALFRGRPAAAVRLAEQVLTSAAAGDAAVVAAASPASHGLARGGRTGEALRVNDRGRDALERAQEMSQFRSPLLHSRVTALVLAGRLADATGEAEGYHRYVLRQPWSRAGLLCACVLCGQAALARGAPSTATRWFHEAAGSPSDLEPVAWLYWCLLGLAEARAMVGDAGGAEDALVNARAVRRPVFVLWTPDALIAEAWVAAAQGEMSRAGSLAEEAAGLARDTEQFAVEALALHTSVRLGESSQVAGRLRALSALVDGELVPTLSAHADQLEADDGPGLDRVSARFEAIGARLLAAEASAHAAAAHRRAGRRASAVGSAAGARRLRDACEGARTPALGQAGSDVPLTRREREVAGLAARGLTNRAIAERLVVSVRTVGNHLDSAYAKLGVHSRSELATALGLDRRQQ